MSAIQNCFLFSECKSLNGATSATPAPLAAQAPPAAPAESIGHAVQSGPDRIGPDRTGRQTRPNQTRLDRTGPDTRLDQTGLTTGDEDFNERTNE